jgi:hypothetical protein
MANSATETYWKNEAEAAKAALSKTRKLNIANRQLWKEQYALMYANFAAQDNAVLLPEPHEDMRIEVEILLTDITKRRITFEDVVNTSERS